MKYLSKEEVNKALSNALECNLKHYTILNVLAHTGVRASECKKIRVDAFNHDVYTFGVIGKGARYRDIHISKELSQIVKYWVKVNNLKSHEYLWSMTRQNIGKICRKYANKNPHAFRHTYAINLLKTTRNIEFVRQSLGHKQLSTTQKYLYHMDFAEEIDKIGGLYK